MGSEICKIRRPSFFSRGRLISEDRAGEKTIASDDALGVATYKSGYELRKRIPGPVSSCQSAEPAIWSLKFEVSGALNGIRYPQVTETLRAPLVES